jgi:hypothetical protein
MAEWDRDRRFVYLKSILLKHSKKFLDAIEERTEDYKQGKNYAYDFHTGPTLLPQKMEFLVCVNQIYLKEEPVKWELFFCEACWDHHGVDGCFHVDLIPQEQK